MIKEIQVLNADTGTSEHFELHRINKDKRGKVKSVELFQNGELHTFQKTGQAIFYTDEKTISIPAYELNIQ